MKKKVLFYGNCQLSVLSRMLQLQNPKFNEEYEVLKASDYKLAHIWLQEVGTVAPFMYVKHTKYGVATPEIIKAVEQITEDADIIIFQKLHEATHDNRPVVLGEKDAMLNPLYVEIDINNPDANFYKTDNSNWKYHRSCYLRLLAYCQYVRKHGATLYADYDVINYSFIPDILNYMEQDSILKGERCTVYLGEHGINDIEQAINRFDKTPGEISNSWRDKNSSSDMHVMVRYTTVFKTITCNLITKERSEKNRTYYCQNAGQDGYMDSPLVHYDGGTCGRNIPEECKRLRRAELVQKLRPI